MSSPSLATINPDGRSPDPNTIATLQSVGHAQKMIDVFGQDLFIALQSPVWQDRDGALKHILSNIEDHLKKEDS